MNSKRTGPATRASNAPNLEDFATFTVIKSTKPSNVGKRYSLEDGKLRKRAVAHISEGIARSVTAITIHDMCREIERLSGGHDEVICPALWLGDSDAHDGQQFTIITERDLSKMLSLPVGAPELAGIHIIRGHRTAARLKRGLRPSCLLLIDADNPEGMPVEQENWSIQQRLEYLEPLVPHISDCERVEYRANSNRVRHESEQPKGASHAIIRVDDPAMIPILKEQVRVGMVLRERSFLSPRRSGTTGEVIGHSPRTVVDLTVLDPGRLIFCSRPTLEQSAIDAGYVIDDADVRIVNEGGGDLTLSGIELPDNEALVEYKRRTGSRLSYARSGAGSGTSLAVHSAGELKLDTPIERRGETRTLREWLATMQDAQKLRCEAPFRLSQSEAAFITRHGPVAGIVHDVGNSTTYHLDGSEVLADFVAEARETLTPFIAESSAMFGPTPADIIPAGEGDSTLDRLAQEIRPTNLRPELLPDADLTQGGKVSIKQAVSPVRVGYVMRQIGVQASMNVYGGAARLSFPKIPWYDPASDRSEAAFGTVLHACIRCGMTAQSSIRRAIMQIAEAKPFNPILDWIATRPWDGVSRFDKLAASITLRDPAQEPWKRVALRRWLIQAVVAWRNYDKGDAAQGVGFVLALQGPKAAGKTSWVKSLLPPGEVAEGVELHLDRNSVDAIMGATTKPIAELGELDRTLSRSAVSALKNFFLRGVDTYRAPYGLAPSAHPRCTVFVATINPKTFLNDGALARRIWPFEVFACNAVHGIDLQQMWAEVATWADAGEQHWLTDAETEMHATAIVMHELDGQVSDLVSELVEQRNLAAGRPESEWHFEKPSNLLARRRITANTTNYQALREEMDRAGFTYNTNLRAWRVPPMMSLPLPIQRA